MWVSLQLESVRRNVDVGRLIEDPLANSGCSGPNGVSVTCHGTSVVHDINWGVIPIPPITGPRRSTIMLNLENKESSTRKCWFVHLDTASFRLATDSSREEEFTQSCRTGRNMNHLHRPREGITRQGSREGVWMARLIPYWRPEKGGSDNSNGLSEVTAREKWQVRNGRPGFQMQWWSNLSVRVSRPGCHLCL